MVSDWSNPDIVYAGEYLGIITRHDRRTGESRNVSAWPENPSGKGGEDMKYRFQWTAPIHVSPHDANVVYHGAQVIFRTANGGQSWDVISPDLTRNDKSRQKWSGGPITGDNTGVETWGDGVHDRRVAEGERSDLGRKRRRARARHERRREELVERHRRRCPARRGRARSASSKPRRSTPPRHMSSSTTIAWTT